MVDEKRELKNKENLDEFKKARIKEEEWRGHMLKCVEELNEDIDDIRNNIKIMRENHMCLRGKVIKNSTFIAIIVSLLIAIIVSLFVSIIGGLLL